MPKHTKKEIKEMAQKVVDGLSSYDYQERTMSRSVVVRVAYLSNISLEKAETNIRNLAAFQI